MAGGFAGANARSVWCWYGAGFSGHGRLTAAEQGLNTAFGPLRADHFGDPVLTVKVSTEAAGWAIASWLITHANGYRIGTVRFAGYQWTAAGGQHGWLKARPSHRWPQSKLTVAFG
jgi:hypothetical protein